jgi:hypothetical protein
MSCGFGVRGSGFRVQGSGFLVQSSGSGFRVRGSGLWDLSTVMKSRLKVQVPGVRWLRFWKAFLKSESEI